ncbi:hypothetical protein LQ327_09905 [Actinomycetospora endophytica]|uniref:Uncharacterized protein n=1 Tax=Actinomycetospora endophytica TaxID=2291215 RepID=A0ABS8P9J1_9PSEU|nr:hypothetical protein [Actinomycetospora endophytica]MCD2193689.1 hypothetical protein [Actinomycetospora endophytica]
MTVGEQSTTAADRSRCRIAAAHAQALQPGALGELIERELRAWADFGYQFDGDRLVPQLADEILHAASRPAQ